MEKLKDLEKRLVALLESLEISAVETEKRIKQAKDRYVKQFLIDYLNMIDNNIRKTKRQLDETRKAILEKGGKAK